MHNWYLIIDTANQFFSKVFFSGEKGLKKLTHNLYTNDKITVTIEKAKAEIEAKYLTPESKETIQNIVIEGLMKLQKSAQELIEQYRMNQLTMQ
ncbi:MAG: hypothetical protein IPM74_17035 [Crocinitomicaceae bacterium]|nr:hypothetical protein [Crocinitomicaceae bacterium]